MGLFAFKRIREKEAVEKAASIPTKTKKRKSKSKVENGNHDNSNSGKRISK